MTGVEIISSSAIESMSSGSNSYFIAETGFIVIAFISLIVALCCFIDEEYACAITFAIILVISVVISIIACNIGVETSAVTETVGTKYYIKVDSSASLIEFGKRYEIIDIVVKDGADGYSYYWVKENKDD